MKSLPARKWMVFYTIAALATTSVSSATASPPVEIVKLLPSDGMANDRFGTSVSLDGNTALIGADNVYGFGAGIVFENVAGVWTETAMLTAGDLAAGDRYGFRVSLDGDTALVGAPWENEVAFRSGAVYVFVRVNGAWQEQAKLTLTAGQAPHDAQFGSSVSLDGDTALIGASQKDGKKGAAFVFERVGAAWSQTATLTASDGGGGDTFGFSVSLDGDTALIGKLQESIGNGAAYVFQRVGATWTEETKLTAADGVFNDRFGRSVSLDADTALIGAIGDTDFGQLTGSAYVFTRDAGGWTQQAKLTASDGASWKFFGISTALDDDAALIGAYGDNDNGSLAGAVYLFQRDAGAWTESAKLTASDGTAADYFGNAVALEGHTSLVGAFWDDAVASTAGSAYIFVANPNTPPTANAGDDKSIRAGDTVCLYGLDSHDDNTDSEDLIYDWSFTSYPGVIEPPISDPDTATPCFVADLTGTYVVELVVTDEGGLSSDPAEVIISTDNLAPTAVAASDFGIYIVGDTANLDGTGSSDPEMDSLTFSWSHVAPAGSTSTISDPASSTTTLLLDVVGTYDVSLSVSDFLGAGTPDSVPVVATTAEDFAVIQIVDASDVVLALGSGQVTAGGNQNALGNFFQQAIAAIDKDDPATAVDKLQKARERTDGCILNNPSAPDGNGPSRDWVTDCAVQAELYALLTEAIDALNQ